MRVQFGVADAIGPRAKQEDSLAFLAPAKVGVVCDGLGAHSDGDIASSVIVRELILFRKEMDMRKPGYRSAEELTVHVQAGIRKIHRTLRDYNMCLSNDMCTTLAGLMFIRSKVVAFNVGDSRAYRLGDSGILNQLSIDHNRAGELLRLSLITPEIAAFHPGKSVLTQAVGSPLTFEVDPFVCTAAAQVGDKFLVCSDGLLVLTDEEICEVLRLCEDAKDAAGELLRRAESRTLEDNVAILTAFVVE